MHTGEGDKFNPRALVLPAPDTCPPPPPPACCDTVGSTAKLFSRALMRLSFSDRACLSAALSVLLLSMAAADDLPEDCVCEVKLMRSEGKWVM